MLILHGENVVASRNRLQEEVELFRQKSAGGEIIRLTGRALELSSLIQATESRGLLAESRLVVVENLFGLTKSAEKQKLTDYLKANHPKNVLIWEGKKIDGRLLISFRPSVMEFPLQATVFRFLDSLSPLEPNITIRLFRLALESSAPELIFYLLVRQVRLLIVAADLGKSALSGVPPWKQFRLVDQARKFGLTRLTELYRQLLFIDWRQKTSRTPFSLVGQLEVLLVSL